MKEFAMRHPLITLLICDITVSGVTKCVFAITGYKNEITTVINKEDEKED